MKKVILMQVKKELTHDRAWRSWNEVRNDFNLEDYDTVYQTDIDDNVTAEGVFIKFNTERPSDYTGRSASVSDVIYFPDNGKAYYVSDVGMEDISCIMDSFLNKQVASREEQKAEAIERLKYLGVLPTVIESFSNGKILASEYNLGLLYEVDQPMKDKIKQLERNGDMVFHVVKGTYSVCDEEMVMTSYLILDNDKEEWKWNHNEIEDGIVFTYTVNETAPEFSEYGNIIVAPLNGGLTRSGKYYDYLVHNGRFKGNHPDFG